VNRPCALVFRQPGHAQDQCGVARLKDFLANGGPLSALRLSLLARRLFRTAGSSQGRAGVRRGEANLDGEDRSASSAKRERLLREGPWGRPDSVDQGRSTRGWRQSCNATSGLFACEITDRVLGCRACMRLLGARRRQPNLQFARKRKMAVRSFKAPLNAIFEVSQPSATRPLPDRSGSAKLGTCGKDMLIKWTRGTVML
jgi:hypothetical protein